MTKLECEVCRAYAIIAIFLHNYIHWLPNTPQENEFEFDGIRHWDFIHSIESGNDIFINLLSYLGHLGVPVFVFLSGYGLAQKYGQQTIIGLKSFIVKHYTKLLKPLLLGMLVYLFVMYIKDGEWPTFQTFALQCLMLQNLIVPFERFGSPEPYWYFGMTMQLYVIYIVFVYKHSLRWIITFTLLSIIFLVFLGSFDKFLPLFVWLKYNSIGWLIPFFLGIILSKYPQILFIKNKKGYMALIILLSFSLLVLFGCNFYTWLFIPAIAVILAIYSTLILPDAVKRIAAKIGSLSLFIFVIHPIIRELTIDIGYYGHPYCGIVIYSLITLLIAYAIKKIKTIIFISHTDR